MVSVLVVIGVLAVIVVGVLFLVRWFLGGHNPGPF
jgi:hypothetical protein